MDTAPEITDIKITSENVIVNYGDEAETLSFDEVDIDMVEWMKANDETYSLLIDFVNAFTAVDDDCFELTAAQMNAIEMVLEHDFKA